MKINRGDSQDKGSQSRQAYHAAPAPAPKRPVQPDPDPQDLYEDAEGPDEYAEDDDDEPVRRRFPIGLVVLVVILAIVGIGGWKVFQFYGEVAGDGELGPEQTVTIEQGSTVADITNVLKEDGVIQYDWLFKLYAKYSGRASGLQYGDFTLRSGMDYNTILKTLSVQQVKRKTITITFPEGYTAVAIAQKMEENGLCSVDDFLACANGEDGSDFSQYDFWNAIPDTEGRLMKCEGYLFPDTYEFFTDDSVYNYVNTFYKEFDAKTSDLWDTINEKGTTMNDVVILASFIQEEAGMPAEDAKVSACFHNRLESDDPQWAEHKLESNASSYIMNDSDNNYLWNSPTAAYYGWPEQGAVPDDVLAHYDTYRISGLPAGSFLNMARVQVGGVSLLSVICLVIFALCAWMFRNSKSARHLLLSGDNQIAAKKRGINTNRLRVSVMAMSGLMCGIGAALTLSNLTSADTTTGSDYAMSVIGAVVIGGTKMGGGAGSMWGSLIGIALVTVIQNGLVFLGLQSGWRSLFIGVTMLIAIAIDTVVEKRALRRHGKQ